MIRQYVIHDSCTLARCCGFAFMIPVPKSRIKVRPSAPKHMTNDDRLLELRRQRDFLRAPDFRTSMQTRRDVLSLIVPLLNFNEVYYSNAVPIADVLGRPGFSSNY